MTNKFKQLHGIRKMINVSQFGSNQHGDGRSETDKMNETETIKVNYQPRSLAKETKNKQRALLWSDFFLFRNSHDPRTSLLEINEIRVLHQLRNSTWRKIFVCKIGCVHCLRVESRRSKFKVNTNRMRKSRGRLVPFVDPIRKERSRHAGPYIRKCFVRTPGQCSLNSMRNRSLILSKFSCIGRQNISLNRVHQQDYASLFAPRYLVDAQELDGTSLECICSCRVIIESFSEQHNTNVMLSQVIEQAFTRTPLHQLRLLTEDTSQQYYGISRDPVQVYQCSPTKVSRIREETDYLNHGIISAMSSSICFWWKPDEQIWLREIGMGQVSVWEETATIDENAFSRIDHISSSSKLNRNGSVNENADAICWWNISNTIQFIGAERLITLHLIFCIVSTVRFLMLSFLLVAYLTSNLFNIGFLGATTHNVTASIPVDLDKATQICSCGSNFNAQLTRNSKRSSYHTIRNRRKQNVQCMQKVAQRLKYHAKQFSGNIHCPFESQPSAIDTSTKSMKCDGIARTSCKFKKISPNYGHPHPPSTLTVVSKLMLDDTNNRGFLLTVGTEDEHLTEKRYANFKDLLSNCSSKIASSIKKTKSSTDDERNLDGRVGCAVRSTNTCERARVFEKPVTTKTGFMNKTKRPKPQVQLSAADFLEPGEIPSIFELCRLREATRMQAKTCPQCSLIKKMNHVKSDNTLIGKHRQSIDLLEHQSDESSKIVRKIKMTDIVTEYITNKANPNVRLDEANLSRNQNNISSYEEDVDILFKQCSSRSTKSAVRGCNACCLRVSGPTESTCGALTSTDLNEPRLLTLQEAEVARLPFDPPPDHGDSINGVYGTLAHQRRGKHIEFHSLATNPSTQYQISQDQLDRSESKKLSATLSNASTISVDEFGAYTARTGQRFHKCRVWLSMKRIARRIKCRTLGLLRKREYSTAQLSPIEPSEIRTHLLSLLGLAGNSVH